MLNVNIYTPCRCNHQVNLAAEVIDVYFAQDVLDMIVKRACVLITANSFNKLTMLKRIKCTSPFKLKSGWCLDISPINLERVELRS